MKTILSRRASMPALIAGIALSFASSANAQGGASNAQSTPNAPAAPAAPCDEAHPTGSSSTHHGSHGSSSRSHGSSARSSSAHSSSGSRAQALPTTQAPVSNTSGELLPQPTNESSHRSSMIGGDTVAPGHIIVGGATGYPFTQGRIMWGMSEHFDMGVFTGLTYGGGVENKVKGIRQSIGLDLQVPLRWTMFHMGNAPMALRVVPYFRIGSGHPATSFGGVIGPRFTIPIRNMGLILGAETRVGFATLKTQGNRNNGFDGAVYAVVGMETILGEKWLLNLELNGGGIYGNSGIGGGGGLFNVMAGFGYLIK